MQRKDFVHDQVEKLKIFSYVKPRILIHNGYRAHRMLETSLLKCAAERASVDRLEYETRTY